MKFTPRSATLPSTGDFQIALVIRRPCHSTSRTCPTFTESTRAAISLGIISPSFHEPEHV